MVPSKKLEVFQKTKPVGADVGCFIKRYRDMNACDKTM